MHSLYDALPVPVRITRGALVAHRYTYAPPRCRTSQYHMTFIHLSETLWNNFADPVIDGVGLAGFKSRANAFSLALAAPLLSSIFSVFFSLSLGFIVGPLSLDRWGVGHSLPALHCRPLLIIIIIIIIITIIVIKNFICSS